MSAPEPGTPEAAHRYGLVFALAFVMVVFLIAAPNGDWTRAVALGIEFGALLVVIVTSRERERVRRARGILAGAVTAAVVLGIGLGILPAALAYGLIALLALVIPLSLVGGLVRLLRTKGVTAQVVSGVLAIYLFVGLLFTAVIGITAHVSDRPYFTQGTSGTVSERTYYSFTVLTTTGFGDFTAAIPVGRALAVLEMLTGQLYLVTVIGIVVGNYAGGRRTS